MGGAPAILFVSFAISGLIGAAIGSFKGREVAGFFLGFLGFIGWIIVALLPRSVEDEARRQLAVEERARRLGTPLSVPSAGEEPVDTEVVYSMSTWSPEQTPDVLAQLDTNGVAYSIEGEDQLVVDKDHESAVDRAVGAATGDMPTASGTEAPRDR